MDAVTGGVGGSVAGIPGGAEGDLVRVQPGISHGAQSFGYALLPWKVRVPGCVDDAIGRPGVSAKLNRGLFCKLTSVVASAGYGKTCAVASWATGLARRGGASAPVVAWYAIGAQEGNAQMFWGYVCAALCAAEPQLEGSLADLRFPEDEGALARALDCAIVSASALRDRIVLVLDDFHNVQDEPSIAWGMRYLVQNLPANMHLVITSRRPLALPLAKMRVAGQLVSIDENDLRFSSDEASEFFARSSACRQADSRQAQRQDVGSAPITCQPDMLARIEAYTHGWPAGCRLVAMLGEGGQAGAALDSEEVRDGMSDYLFEEVFLGLPADYRDFLLKTSVVESFCPSLAAALTGMDRAQAQGMAEALAQGDLFIERIEHKGLESWYRYHLLFADMLRRRAAGTASSLDACRRAARDWYAENGYLEQAVSLCATLGDWDVLRDIIVANWRALYMSDSHQELVRWASRMPEPVVLSSPFLCAVLAMPYALAGRFDLANSLIMHAVDRLKSGEDFLFALCMVQKAFLASFKARYTDMRQFAERALKYLPDDEPYLRGMMFQVLASSYSATDPLRARSLFTQAVQEQAGLNNKNLACSALGNLAMCCANLGLMGEARMHAHAALSLYGEAERPCKPMLSHSYLAQALADYEAGELDEARASLEAFDRLTAPQGTSVEMTGEALALKAKLLACLGGVGAPRDAQGAGADGEARALFVRGLNASVVGAAMVFPQASLVKPHAAAVCEAARAGLTAGMGHEGQLRVLEALAEWCAGPVSKARCEEFCAFVDAIDPQEPALVVHAQVAAALLCESAACIVRADAYLQAAVMRVETGGPTRCLVENADALRPTATRLMATCRSSLVVARLNELFGGHTDGAGRQDASGISCLTEREVDVMRLVAAGMSVAQAAEHMVVSRETVKKHLANIYAKLGVHSKMQAVALLRERGVL